MAIFGYYHWNRTEILIEIDVSFGVFEDFEISVEFGRILRRFPLYNHQMSMYNEYM